MLLAASPALALVVLAESPASAFQRRDSCTTPTAIAGSGTFHFDATSATTGIEGQAEGLCYAFGLSAEDFDVWFDWTSDFTGQAIVSTCAGTSDDTKSAGSEEGGAGRLHIPAGVAVVHLMSEISPCGHSRQS